MSLATLKVLVQWLPSKTLARQRAITMGPKWGTEVQQTPVRIHDEYWPLALALASHDDGRFVLQVGFKGQVRHNGIGFVLASAPTTQPGALIEEAPTIKKLLRKAARECGLSREQLNAEVDDCAKMQKAELTKSKRAAKAASEYAREHSAMMNVDAFNRVAVTRVEYADGHAEVLPPGDGVLETTEALAKKLEAGRQLRARLREPAGALGEEGETLGDLLSRLDDLDEETVAALREQVPEAFEVESDDEDADDEAFIEGAADDVPPRNEPSPSDSPAHDEPSS